MKILKKFTAIMLTLSLCICNLTMAYASPKTNSIGDIYAEEGTEIANIDGVIYTFNHFYDGDGNRAIEVVNESTNNIDIVKYDVSNGIIYQNDDMVATVQNESSQNNTLMQARDNAWIFMSSGSNYVSWAKGVAAAIVAGTIALVLASLGAAGVIAAIGPTALGIIAAASIGGRVDSTYYRFNSTWNIQYREDWSFTASTNDYYGVYMNFYQ